MRNEDQRLQASGRRVSGHGSRGIAGGHASHALLAEPQRLRHSASHAVVFERAGGIEALMLERQVVESAVGSGSRRRQQWSVAFAERDHLTKVIQEWDQLAIAPDAALVQREIAGPAVAPDRFERSWIGLPIRVGGFEQSAAPRAVIDHLSNGKTRAAGWFETNELGWHE